MDIRKFSQLHDLIINEDVDQARELFHEIVVEKSREIFESIMTDDMDDDSMEEGMGGQVGQMMDEISAEEAGVMEDDDEADIDFDDDAEEAGADLTHDMEMDHDDGEDFEHEEVEDAVIRIEDKLDQLMAEFEEIMGGGEDFGDEGDDEEAMMGAGDDEDFGDDEDEEAMMEAVQLQKVSVTHGDNGVQNKSAVGSAANAGQAGMASKPVRFAGGTESAPNGPKAPSNAYSKGESNLPGAGKFKNAPGHRGLDLDKTPKPVSKDGASGTKSPVAESRRPARRPTR
jgi:hypothetical protein